MRHTSAWTRRLRPPRQLAPRRTLLTHICHGDGAQGKSSSCRRAWNWPTTGCESRLRSGSCLKACILTAGEPGAAAFFGDVWHHAGQGARGAEKWTCPRGTAAVMSSKTCSRLRGPIFPALQTTDAKMEIPRYRGNDRQRHPAGKQRAAPTHGQTTIRRYIFSPTNVSTATRPIAEIAEPIHHAGQQEVKRRSPRMAKMLEVKTMKGSRLMPKMAGTYPPRTTGRRFRSPAARETAA